MSKRCGNVEKREHKNGTGQKGCPETRENGDEIMIFVLKVRTSIIYQHEIFPN
jgi:hypothetical protein